MRASGHTEPTVGDLLLAGGVAGVMSWALLHPVDVVKSCVQADPKSTVRSVLRDGIASEGYGFLLRGFYATVLRAFPVSAVTFLVYEQVMAAMPA